MCDHLISWLCLAVSTNTDFFLSGSADGTRRGGRCVLGGGSGVIGDLADWVPFVSFRLIGGPGRGTTIDLPKSNRRAL